MSSEPRKRPTRTPCENECGRNTEKLRTMPGKGAGLFCSRCVKDAEEKAYKAKQHTAKLAAMDPDRFVGYETARQQSANSPKIKALRDSLRREQPDK